MTEKITVDAELAKDPNYLAYMSEKAKGTFDHLSRDIWVIFSKGALIGIAYSVEEALAINSDTPCFIHQPNMPEVIYDVPNL